MEKEPLSIDIRLNHPEGREYFYPDEEITGEIRVTANCDLKIERLAYRVKKEARGKLEAWEGESLWLGLLDSDQFYEGELRTFPFSFVFEQGESYHGKNVNIISRMEVYYDSKEAVRKGPLITKVKSLVTQSNKFNTYVYLPFSEKSMNYEISAINKIPEPISLRTPLYLLGFLIFILIFLGFSSVVHSGFVWSLAGLLLIAVLGYWGMHTRLARNMRLNLRQVGSEEIEAVIQNDEAWRFINRLSLSYRICEEVIDKRGTSPAIYTENIYCSGEVEIAAQENTIRQLFTLPPEKPASTRLGDARIYWYFEIEIHTVFGLVFSRGSEFKVRRIARKENLQILS